MQSKAKEYGPELVIAKETHRRKYRQSGETFRDSCARVAQPLADNTEHFHHLKRLLMEQIFLPGGRIQSSIGSPQQTTALNCFVSCAIEDSMEGIMDAAKEAAQTMRLGGGIGFDFSTIRPKESIITTMGSKSSGAVSFMSIFDAVCSTVKSAGDRRGAMMGCLRVDHPDIEEFIEAKCNLDNLTNFNISVGITDEFMEAVETDSIFELRFKGDTYKKVKARFLWDKIMRATYDWAEPGVLFLDTINNMNNLRYCETIAATNPCAEEPLPPYGACLLGSLNITKLVDVERKEIDYGEMVDAIHTVVRAMDNVIDTTTYPLPAHRDAAYNNRRIGLGCTGLANAVEFVTGCPYGSLGFMAEAEKVFKTIRDQAYRASIELAAEKGCFPNFNADEYMKSNFVADLPDEIKDLIEEYGIRNSHLISYAPAGTISVVADNVSSGIEPVFSHQYNRTILVDGEEHTEVIKDYGYRVFGVRGKTADECTIYNHLDVLALATKYSDSAVSKTINVGDNVGWQEFKDIYFNAWRAGCKGCTTFRAAGKRFGILNAISSDNDDNDGDTGHIPVNNGGGDGDGAACYINPLTGNKECS